MSDGKKDESTPGPSCTFTFRKPVRRGQQNARKREEKPETDSCKQLFWVIQKVF